mmetsp:Transcript_1798/g.5357  ORF Transcript_1798/g.5357 Transcript_1798/m.5357 type:complete len:466 (-) Transcript_1798:216-1613(-)
MRRLVRAESRRKKPTAIQAHTWTGDEIREKPEEAFALFDYRKDGQISVAELLFTVRKTNAETRQRGSIFDEMRLFELLDVDGDAVISKDEFCTVVADPSLFSDEALGAIAKMATRRATEEATKQKAEPSDDVEKDAMEYEAIAAATGLVNGKQVSLRRSASMREAAAVSEEDDGRLKVLDDDCEVIVELYAIGLPAVSRPWYDVFKVSDPKTADPYVLIVGKRRGKVVTLGSTGVLYETLVGAWDAVTVRHSELQSLDEPFKIEFELWDARLNQKVGVTLPVDLGAPATVPFDHASEVAIGPLPCLTREGNVNGKILGMRKWINPKNLLLRDEEERTPRTSFPPSSIRSEQYYEDCACAGFHFAFCTADGTGACDGVCGPSSSTNSRRALPPSNKNKLDFLFQAEKCRSPRSAKKNKVNFASSATTSSSSGAAAASGGKTTTSTSAKTKKKTTTSTTKQPAKKKK